MMRDDKRKKKVVPIRQTMNNNSLIAGIDLGDSTSLATILTATGDIADRFCFQMNDQGYALFANKVPRDTRLAFEATSTAYPFFRMLKGRGYDDVIWRIRSLGIKEIIEGCERDLSLLRKLLQKDARG